MIELKVFLENITTDATDVILTLPMEESKIRTELVDGCEYLVADADSPISFSEKCDVYDLNKILDRINAANPHFTMDIVLKLLNASDAIYIDDEGFLEKICEGDFFYKEIRKPSQTVCDLTRTEYAAYYLCTVVNVPFSRVKNEIETAKKEGFLFKDWLMVLDVYEFMGFKFYMDDEDSDKIYIISMEDAEE